jgi:putative endonuclease
VPHRRQILGTNGEAAVAEWYRDQGYEVVDTNWRCRQGEIDLIVRKGRILVFCEVKTRSSTAFGTPAEAVTRDKRDRLRVLAARYLDDAPFRAREVRFDVASVLDGEIEILEGCF